MPLASGPATPALDAPSAPALPQAAPLPVGQFSQPADAYAYLDRADGFSEAVEDTPPDYGFSYDGVNPWGWQTGDGDTEFAEPVDGGYRYYYYEPGADQPYLIRDPDYSYAYSDGRLAAVYGIGGALLAGALYARHAEDAARYRARGAELYRASRGGNRHRVVAANWDARRSAIAADRQRWSQGRQRDAQWNDYHRQHAAQERAHWQPIAEHRQQEARRTGASHDIRDHDALPTPPRVPHPAPFSHEARNGYQPQGPAPRDAGPDAPHPGDEQQIGHRGAIPPHAPAMPHRLDRPQGQHGVALHTAPGIEPGAAQSHDRFGGGFEHRHETAPRAEFRHGAAVQTPHAGAPRPQASHEAPHVSEPRMATPRSEAPRAEVRHAEAPHMAAPHAEAPHAHPAAPHPQAPHPQAPHPQGGGEHHGHG